MLFSANAYSLLLKCHFLVFQYSFFGEYYSCRSYNFTTTLSNRTITSVSGKHLSNTHRDVHQLYIRGQSCEVIPRGIQRFFPKLQGLSLPHAKILYLFNDDLSELKNLRSVDFAYNKFTRIDSSFFASNHQMEIISFRRCRELETFGTSTFDALKNLTTLQLTDLKCINREALRNRTEVVRLIREIKVHCRDSNDTLEETKASSSSEEEVDECQTKVMHLERELASALKKIKKLTGLVQLQNSLNACNCLE